MINVVMGQGPPDTLVVRWEATVTPDNHVAYFVDDVAVGQGDVGFDAILQAIKSRPHVRVVLRMTQPGSLGGTSLVASLPFRARFHELEALLGPNRLTFDCE